MRRLTGERVRGPGLIALLIALVAATVPSVSAGHDGAESRVSSIDQATRTLLAPLTSSRRFRYTLSITLREQRRITRSLGYNAGTTNLRLDPAWVSLRVQNRTPGRDLEVFSSSGGLLRVAAAWRLPAPLVSKYGSGRDYLVSDVWFGGYSRPLTIPQNSTGAIPLSYGGKGVAGAEDRDVAALTRLFKRRPTYIGVVDWGSELVPSKVACDGSSPELILVFTGGGRRLAITDDLCAIF